ncbi:hypothetical protein COU74_04735 [Candidatus Peregrinibacteria bacterium CG10_big_fil_rev_8_21_14_0_10_36_19]|nr:MAG: hypothetical protein COU74_04735 [Candidatus Peregrinibacteria bacterium CG10_big_fil_rev_8_21_14_0_10_36_19]
MSLDNFSSDRIYGAGASLRKDDTIVGIRFERNDAMPSSFDASHAGMKHIQYAVSCGREGVATHRIVRGEYAGKLFAVQDWGRRASSIRSDVSAKVYGVVIEDRKKVRIGMAALEEIK